MTPTKSLEHQITRELMRVRKDYDGVPVTRAAEFVVRLAAAAAVVTLVGIQIPELLLAGVAVSAVYVLGLR